MRRYPLSRQALRATLTLPPVLAVGVNGLSHNTYDVVVVGAGVFGLSAAYALARGGARVAVIEKGVVGGEASGRAVGFLETVTLDSIKAEAAAISLAFWREISAMSSDTIGLGTGLTFFAGKDEAAQVGDWKAWCSQMGTHHKARVLSEIDARRQAPEIRADFGLSGAIYSPDDMYVEPRLAIPALARLAMKAGADLVQDHAVRRVLFEGHHVRGVETADRVVYAPHVVLAGGIWNSVFARHIGLQLPQLYGFATAVEFSVTHGALPEIAGGINATSFRPSPMGTYVGGPQLSVAPLTPLHIAQAWRFRHAARALRPFLDLGLSARHFAQIWRALRWNGKGISPFEACPILAMEPRDFARQANQSRIGDAFGIADYQERAAWAGAIACSPDNLPILDSPKPFKGLHIGAGMYFGLTFGPAMGLGIASEILNQKFPFDPTPYRLSRFTDGSTLRFTA